MSREDFEAQREYSKQMHKERVAKMQGVEEQERACPILDDNCPYPHLECYECEVYCVMERANKKLEERNQVS